MITTKPHPVISPRLARLFHWRVLLDDMRGLYTDAPSRIQPLDGCRAIGFIVIFLAHLVLISFMWTQPEEVLQEMARKMPI